MASFSLFSTLKNQVRKPRKSNCKCPDRYRYLIDKE